MIGVFTIIIVFLVAIDQITKYLARIYLKPLGTIPCIPDIFHLTFVENRGAAFGILQNKTWFFIIITIFILMGMIYYYNMLPSTPKYKWIRISFILIIAGAIGNLIDRIKQGYVIDFFDFRLIQFPVFNVADCYVVVGTFLLAYLLLFVIEEIPMEKE
ncbi:MAG: signal peptidase II [Epulopiscium sp.]|nr:signal peptidase II [Candidatus Epulonipiscium sp.]